MNASIAGNLSADCFGNGTNLPVCNRTDSRNTPTFGEGLIDSAVAICIVTSFLSLITIVGNVLVIASFKVNPRLRSKTNYFIFSLACADLIIGIISMNMFTAYVVQGEWRQGAILCDFWLTVDYVASNASVMNLLVISVDRYRGITKPLLHRVKRTESWVIAWIASAWIVSFVLWAPAIILTPIIEGRTVPPNDCYIQFIFSNTTVTFITALLAFYVPTMVMIFLNWRVYLANKRHLEYTKAFQTIGKVIPVKEKESCQRTIIAYAQKKNEETCKEGDIKEPRKVSFRDSDPSDLAPVQENNGFNNFEEDPNAETQPCLADETNGCDAVLYVVRDSLKNGEKVPKNTELFDLSVDKYARKNSTHCDSISNKTSSSQYSENTGDESAVVEQPFISLALSQTLDLQGLPLRAAERTPTPTEIPRSNSTQISTQTIPTSKQRRLRFAMQRSSSDPTVEKPTNNRRRSDILTSLFSTTSRNLRNKMASNKDNKAARMLITIILVFVVTWLPYNILVLISSLCKDCVNDTLYKLSYCLCYLNSTINPLCYALCSLEFRKTFKVLLCCGRSSRKTLVQRARL